MFSSFLVFPQFAQAPESTGYGFGFSVTAAGLPAAADRAGAARGRAARGRARRADRLPRRADDRRRPDHVLVPDQHVRPRPPVGADHRRHAAGRRHHVRLRRDGEPDRRRRPAVRGRDRDRHQHRHAHRRRLLRRRDRDRDPHLHDRPVAQRRPLHGRVRVLRRGRVHRHHGLAADPGAGRACSRAARPTDGARHLHVRGAAPTRTLTVAAADGEPARGDRPGRRGRARRLRRGGAPPARVHRLRRRRSCWPRRPRAPHASG